MVRKEDIVELAQELMNNRSNIRNLGIVAHIDHGKCISPSTNVLLNDGRLLNAEELYKECSLRGEKVKETESETVYALQEPLQVFSINKNTGQIEKKNISHAWKMKGGRLLRVKLRNGFSVATTPEHRFLLFDGAKFTFKEAKELKKGERVVCARKLDVDVNEDFEENAFELISRKKFYVRLKKDYANRLKEMILSRGTVKVMNEIGSSIKKRSFQQRMRKGLYSSTDLLSLAKLFNIHLNKLIREIQGIKLKDSFEINWPSDWGELFYAAGLLIGDGCGTKFIVGKEELGNTFERICKNLGFEVRKTNYKRKTPEIITNKTFQEFLEALFDYPKRKKSHNICLSEFALTAPNQLLKMLLRGYFDTDGGIEKARRAITITSASNKMIEQLQLVLMRFGCLAIREKDNTLSISGNSARQFNKNIGFGLSEKQKKALMLEEKSVGSTVLDCVPCRGLKNLREHTCLSKAGISHHYYKYENGQYVPQLNTFKTIQQTLQKQGISKQVDVSALAFIEVQSIDEEFSENVYDFSVPENHNFIAEGVCIHNTSMTDSLVAACGLISKDLAGKQLFMDFYELEQERGITINAANISLVYDYKGQKYLINLIDTPGHVDFGGDVIRAMRAVDGVIIIVDAVEGVMPQTETVIRQALRERCKPVLFVNKVDRLIKELKVTEQEMQERFIKVITKVNMLIKKNCPEEFKEKWVANVEQGSVVFGSALYKWAISVPQMKETKVTFSDIYTALKNGKEKELAEKIPLYKAIMEMAINHLPNPIEAQKYRIPEIWRGELESDVGKSMQNCDPEGDIAMMVTDVTVDPHAGDVATGRIYSGTLRKGISIKLIGSKRNVIIQQVGVYMGPERVPMEYVPAGNIAAITGVKEVYAGETISSTDMQEFESFKSSAEPVITVSVEAKHTKELPKLIEVIKQITKEDPNIVAQINPETGEHLLSGMGELHLDVTKYRIEHDHKIEITVSPPIVVYNESIRKNSPELTGRSPNKHNDLKMAAEKMPEEMLEKLKESGLKGKIKKNDEETLKKLEGIGLSRDEAKKVWYIHNNCILIDSTRGIQALHEIRELVCQGFKDAMDEGPLAKEKCTGVIIRLLDARLHEDAIHRGPAQILPVVTRTIYACMLSADPILLEPKQKLFINIPQEYMGAVSKELGHRRAQIQEMNTEGDSTIIIAVAPVKELLGFSSEIRSVTQGRAIWTAEFYGYDPLPRELQSQIIKQVRQRKGMDPEVKNAQFFLE